MASPIKRGKHHPQCGFTLIELMIVMSILGLLLSIALPKYFQGLERAKESVLTQDLKILREAIDHFYQDKGIYPDQINDLVSYQYLKEIPVDPITGSRSTWIIITQGDNHQVYDIKSGSEKLSSNGKPYNTW
jgi:general secretion pathway protein G